MALKAAITVFSDHGYEGTSTDALLEAMGISSICEFGRSDPEVVLLNEAAGRTLRSAFERRVVEAKAEGEVAPDLDVRAAAEFMQATLMGIKVAARGGASAETLKGIARLALRAFERFNGAQ